MTVAWGKSDTEYFRAIGIEVDDDPPAQKMARREAQRLDYLRVSVWMFISLLSGFVWYGLLLAGAWVLRHFGVNITGI